MRLSIVGLIAVCAASFQTFAANPFFYVGAAAQKQTVSTPKYTTSIALDGYLDTSFNTAAEGTPYRIFAGYQFNDSWSVEMGYTSYEKQTFTLTSTDEVGRINLTGESQSTSIDMKGIFTMPLNNNLSIKAGLGFAAWSNDTDMLAGTSLVPVLQEESDSGVALLMSAGVNYALTKNIALMLDFDKRSVNSSGVDSIGLGVAFAF